MALETELLLSTTAYYNHSILTPFLSCVTVQRLGFVVEAFVVLRIKLLHKVNNEGILINYVFDKEIINYVRTNVLIYSWRSK
jgi:hypothetical protein